MLHYVLLGFGDKDVSHSNPSEEKDGSTISGESTTSSGEIRSAFCGLLITIYYIIIYIYIIVIYIYYCENAFWTLRKLNRILCNKAIRLLLATKFKKFFARTKCASHFNLENLQSSVDLTV